MNVIIAINTILGRNQSLNTQTQLWKNRNVWKQI